jgi:hypothetical protein
MLQRQQHQKVRKMQNNIIIFVLKMKFDGN